MSVNLADLQKAFFEKHKSRITRRSVHFYLAFTVPWSYSQNIQWVTRLITENELCKKIDQKHALDISHFSLGKSHEKRELSALKICLNQKFLPKSKIKKIIFISARVHPGEAISSHVLRGLIGQIIKNPMVRH